MNMIPPDIVLIVAVKEDLIAIIVKTVDIVLQKTDMANAYLVMRMDHILERIALHMNIAQTDTELTDTHLTDIWSASPTGEEMDIIMILEDIPELNTVEEQDHIEEVEGQLDKVEEEDLDPDQDHLDQDPELEMLYHPLEEADPDRHIQVEVQALILQVEVQALILQVEVQALILQVEVLAPVEEQAPLEQAVQEWEDVQEEDREWEDLEVVAEGWEDLEWEVVEVVVEVVVVEVVVGEDVK